MIFVFWEYYLSSSLILNIFCTFTLSQHRFSFLNQTVHILTFYLWIYNITVKWSVDSSLFSIIKWKIFILSTQLKNLFTHHLIYKLFILFSFFWDLLGSLHSCFCIDRKSGRSIWSPWLVQRTHNCLIWSSKSFFIFCELCFIPFATLSNEVFDWLPLKTS